MIYYFPFLDGLFLWSHYKDSYISKILFCPCMNHVFNDGNVLMTKKNFHSKDTAIIIWCSYWLLNNLFYLLDFSIDIKGPSLSWSFGSWIYIHLSNQCLSPLKLGVRIPLVARCTRCNYFMLLSLSVTCDRSVVFSVSSVFLHQ